MGPKSLTLLAVLPLLLGPGTVTAQIGMADMPTVTGPVQVLEGDLISVGGSVVRLYGIDAPELRQTCRTARGTSYDCGTAARAALERLVGGAEAECTLYARPDRRQAVGRCRIGDIDLGQAMVLRGWAFALTGQSHRYGADQGRAQAMRAGLWSGRAQAPWEWRIADQTADRGGPARRRRP